MNEYCDRPPCQELYYPCPTSKVSNIIIKVFDSFLMIIFEDYDIEYKVVFHKDAVLVKNQAFLIEYKDDHDMYETDVFKYSDIEYHRISKKLFYDFRFHVLEKRCGLYHYKKYSREILKRLCEDFDKINKKLTIIKTSFDTITVEESGGIFRIIEKNSNQNIYIGYVRLSTMDYNDRMIHKYDCIENLIGYVF